MYAACSIVCERCVEKGTFIQGKNRRIVLEYEIAGRSVCEDGCIRIQAEGAAGKNDHAEPVDDGVCGGRFVSVSECARCR